MQLSYWELKNWFSNVDYTIVGSGIVGLHCALSLREKFPKAKILVLEKGVLPQGASTKNAGFACFGSISEILDDLKSHSEDEVVALVEKRWKGLQLLRKRLGDSIIDYKPFGGYELFLKEDEAFLNDLILAGRVEEYYYKPELSGSGLINTEIKPDKTYKLDDYNRFENVEITLKEYIPEVYVRRSNKSVLFKVMNDITGIVFNENPLLLIDNMPIMSADAFAAFDPKGIEKIDLINRVFYFNDQAYAGVISLTSKLGDFGGFELPKDALYLDYYKFASKVKLRDVNVNHDRANKNFPDFRNLLYWNDQAQAGSQPIFPSQLSGVYVVKHSFYDGKNWNTQIDKVEIKD